MYLNKAIIIGNLTRDPEVKALPSGVSVANFSVATNRNFKDKDGNKQEQVEYHNIVVFGAQAEPCGKYLKKGQKVSVEGRLQTRSWEQDGVKKYATEIIADNVQFGAKATGGDKEDNTTSPDADGNTINTDDIPF